MYPAGYHGNRQHRELPHPVTVLAPHWVSPGTWDLQQRISCWSTGPSLSNQRWLYRQGKVHKEEEISYSSRCPSVTQQVVCPCGCRGDGLPHRIWWGPFCLFSCSQPPVKINTACIPAPLNSRMRRLAFACSLVCSKKPVCCGWRGW